MIRVVVHRRALKYYERLSGNEQERVRSGLALLGENPAEYPGVVTMAGEWAGYRHIRVGNLRVIFWVDQENAVICVDHIGPRGDVYRSKPG